MALTVTADSARALFLLHVDYIASAGTQTSADLYRGLSATGPWEFLRTLPLLGQEAYSTDNTAPLGVDVWYRTVANDGTEFIDGPEQLTVSADGDGWLKDPGRPWADIPLTFCEAPEGFCNPPDYLSWVGFTALGHPTDASVFEVLDDEKATSVYARRKKYTGELNVFSNTLAMKTRMEELITAGGPLFLQLPPLYGWEDDHLQTTSPFVPQYIAKDQSRPWRRWTATFRSVRRSAGAIQGDSCANWCVVNDAFANYTAFTAAAGDWGDVADGSLQC